MEGRPGIIPVYQRGVGQLEWERSGWQTLVVRKKCGGFIFNRVLGFLSGPNPVGPQLGELLYLGPANLISDN